MDFCPFHVYTFFCLIQVGNDRFTNLRIALPFVSLVGTHRYAFLVYKQSKHIYASGYPEVDSRTFTQRQQFNLTDFAHHFHLGYPIAGNFFNATYDDYVPFILKQLGIN